jgi:hypothetical protein
MVTNITATTAQSVQRVPPIATIPTTGLDKAASGGQFQVAQPNPSYHLSPELGLVVIQYHTAEGKVLLSFPSQQKLDAYAADPTSLDSNPRTTADVIA